MSEEVISDLSILANTKDEALRPCRLNLDGQTSAEGNCESFFARF